jgi:hypothetical protein
MTIQFEYTNDSPFSPHREESAFFWTRAWAAVGLALVAALLVAEARGQSPAAKPQNLGVPVRFNLQSPSQVTLVIEDERGNRIRNLVAETLLAAGDHTIYWDGYDDAMRNSKGEVTKRRVAPGTYRVRGLTHSGIKMHYEMTVNNPGMPPWATKDGVGGWLADHSPPADILALPPDTMAPNGKGNARFLVCSTSGEAGSEFVWLDSDGRRLFGTNDGFSGGTHLARDVGPNPAPGYSAYVFMSGQRDADNFNIDVRGFKANGGAIEKVARYARPKTLRTFKDDEAYGSDGVAVYNGRIVFAITMLDKLVVADARTKKVVGEIALPSPRAPVFDKEGALVVISEGKVKRFRLEGDKPSLQDEKTIVSEHLADPRRMGLDDRGNIYVSDWGKHHQIKVFDAAGRFLRAIGKPGGPQIGLYDEQSMAHPCGFTFDDRGQIWVAEGDVPRRISIWKKDGTFVRAIYGPAKYGGGGTFDPLDKTRFYYDDIGIGVEFALDWENSTSKVKSVYWRPSMMSQFETMPGLGVAPERAFHHGGRQYMVSSYNGGLRYNQDRGIGICRLDKDGVARPVALIGNASDLVNHLWGWRMKNRDAIVKLWDGQNPDNVLFIWCDRNGDNVAQTDEIQWIAEDNRSKGRHYSGGLGIEPLVHADLSITTSFGTMIPSPRIDDRGVPNFELGKRTRVGDPTHFRPPQIVGDRIVTHGEGEEGAGWQGFDLRGEKRWRYPPTPEQETGGPGAMIAPTRILGPHVTPTTGQAGPVVAINGEMGAVFLLTGDGLFIQTLGGDARQLPPLSEPNPKRDEIIDRISFQQEHFHPTINQTADGKIYLVAGYQQCSILRLEGWDSVRRHDFAAMTLREEDLAGIPPQATQGARKEGRLSHSISMVSKPLKIDGTFAAWPKDIQWMRIDEHASAAVTVDEQNLYLAFRADNPRTLDNSGRDYRYLFKSGGAFDLMLGTDSSALKNRQEAVAGDLRLLVTKAEGQTKAVVFRAVAPGAVETDKVLYESPISKIAFDQVQDISKEIALAQEDGNYEVVVPLKILGFKPGKGMEFLADIGILRGSEGRTMQRVYWSNRNTTIVSDLPSEAKLQPREWGSWKIK